MSKERDKLTESCLATISSNVWQLRHQNLLAKTIPLATRAKFSHVVFLCFFFFHLFFFFSTFQPTLKAIKVLFPTPYVSSFYLFCFVFVFSLCLVFRDLRFFFQGTLVRASVHDSATLSSPSLSSAPIFTTIVRSMLISSFQLQLLLLKDFSSVRSQIR